MPGWGNGCRLFGIGLGVAVILAALLGCFLLRWRGRRRDPTGGGEARRGRLPQARLRLRGGAGAGLEKTSREGVSFSNSFGASEDQSRAKAGEPASVVHFSQAGDMGRLVEAGEVDAKTGTSSPSAASPRQRRGFRRPQGQPERDPHGGGPTAQGRQRGHPEPVQFGRRPLERHGGLRPLIDARKSPARRSRASRRSSPRRRSSRGAPPTRSRRSPGAKATRCSPTRAKRSRRRRGGGRPVRGAARMIRSRPDSGDQVAPEPAAKPPRFFWSERAIRPWAKRATAGWPELVDPKRFPT